MIIVAPKMGYIFSYQHKIPRLKMFYTVTNKSFSRTFQYYGQFKFGVEVQRRGKFFLFYLCSNERFTGFGRYFYKLNFHLLIINLINLSFFDQKSKLFLQ